MLLMGMKMSFTKNPTKPMTTNPMAVQKGDLGELCRGKTEPKPIDQESPGDDRARMD